MKDNQPSVITQADIEARAYKYYTMGLCCWEIGKLMDKSERTIERYMQKGKWLQRLNAKSIEERVFELSNKGKSYSEIAEILEISKSSAYNYLKRYRAKIEATTNQ